VVEVVEVAASAAEMVAVEDMLELQAARVVAPREAVGLVAAEATAKVAAEATAAEAAAAAAAAAATAKEEKKRSC
jgi:hypothetical protein